MTVLCVKSHSCSSVTRRHTYENLFDCPHCEKSFSESINLKRNKLTHSGRKGYKCSQCGKHFLPSEDLKRHHMSNTGEKPFDCPHCGKSFTQPGSLKKHVITHLGQRSRNDKEQHQQDYFCAPV